MAQLKPQDTRSASEIAVDFMILHVEGRLDERIEAEMLQWFDQDPAHLKLFQNALISWWDLEDQQFQPEVAKLRAEALEAYGRANAKRWSRFGRPQRIMLGVLAIGLVAALAAWIAVFLSQ